MELAKIRSLSDEELLHHEKASGEQLFRLRFQVSMGQNDGVKKLRQLRKEIAQIKTVSRERELGVRGATHELVSTATAGEEKKAAKKTAKSAAAKTTAKKSTKKSASASAEKKGAGK
jgi:large subunit ribosomal protein L29